MIGSFCATFLALALLGRFLPGVRTEVACVGEPIAVGFPYARNMLAAHSCKPQCGDGRPRYLLYTNGFATQCQRPPGCEDEGEDINLTCRPPEPGTGP